MNYLDLPILWNLSPYALIPVLIPSYFTYYSIYYNEIWHGYYSATIRVDELIQKIKYKYDLITDVITLECQGKIGAD